MKSSKIDFDQVYNRDGTHCCKHEGPRRQTKNENIISLGCADFEIAAPPAIQEAVLKRAQHPIYGYTEYYPELYSAICSYLLRHHRVKIEQSDVFFSPGVVPGIAMLLDVLLSNGGAVCLMLPEYPPFERIVRENNYKVNYINMVQNEQNLTYSIDFQQAEKQISNSKVLLFSNPHNPTGTAFSKHDLLRLSDICKTHNVKVLSDEIWSDLVFYPNVHESFLNVQSENVLCYFSDSKSFNTAGLQISVLATRDEEMKKIIRRALCKNQIELSNCFALAALEAAMTSCDEWLAQFKGYLYENAKYCVDFIQKNMPKIQVRLPQATSLLWLDFSQLFSSCQECVDFCVRCGVFLVPGSEFDKGCGAKMRLNFGTRRDVLEKAMYLLQEGYDQIVKDK